MSSVGSQLLDSFKSSKEYRHAFVEEKVRTQLAIQIKTMREDRRIGRPEFAALMDKAPSWVFRLEDPNQSPPTISTLLKVAEAFDVDLEIRFRRFSGLLKQLERLTAESFGVPSFEEEIKEGTFDRGIPTEEMGSIMEELGGRNIAGTSFTLPVPKPAMGGLFLVHPPAIVEDGGGMKTRRSPRVTRRTAFARMQRSA